MRDPMRFLRALLLLPVLALVVAPGAAWAKLDAQRWKKAQEDYLRLFSAPGSKEDKADLVRLLLSDEDPRSWKLLVDALVKESEMWVAAQQAVTAKVDEVAVILVIPSAKRYPQDQVDLDRLQDELKKLEAQARLEREVLDDLIQVLAQAPEALRKNLLQRAKGAAEWQVRAAGARVAARNPEEKEAQGYLQKALEQDRDPRVRLAALEALDPASETAQTLLIGRLGDGDWGVQLLAVRLVSERKLTRAIPHLINALEKARPRMAEAFGQALRDLTGQNFEPYGDVWAKWWEENREAFQSQEAVKGGSRAEPLPDVTFYGLPIKSDRVLFVVDISGSMKLETKNPGPAPAPPPAAPTTPKEGEPPAPPPPPPPEEVMSGPKIDVAKDELRKAIKKLPKQTLFNIISFNHTVQQWQEKMMLASEANKEEALKWVRTLNASGSTFIDGALRLAFRLAGTGVADKSGAYEVQVDTIVLMSDGAPTDNAFPNSTNMDPEVILQHVREWNPNKRIVIHAIAVDMVEGVEFMQKLAAENGGTYLDR